MDLAGRLKLLYQRLLDHFGPQHWWPGDTPFEVLVGAMLTQNTSWTNAAQAIANLKKAEVLSLAGLRALAPEQLAGLIRPAGYYNLKEKRLRNLLDLAARDFDGNLNALFALPLSRARKKLLSCNGVGPETADSILLYAGGLPTFVVDAYTRRVLERHGFDIGKSDYGAVQALFMDHLPRDAPMFNEYHALLVILCKEYCKKSSALCSGCPAEGW